VRHRLMRMVVIVTAALIVGASAVFAYLENQ
jgi:hypothetical protein